MFLLREARPKVLPFLSWYHIPLPNMVSVKSKLMANWHLAHCLVSCVMSLSSGGWPCGLYR